MLIRNTLSAIIALAAASQPTFAQKPTITAEEAHEIGVEAYTYLYPLITMHVTRQQHTNHQSGEKAGWGPVNTFHHMRTFPPANARDVVRPNFDTLYSRAWLDLTHEPVIISVPDTDGRYYLLPMLDMWSDVFAVPGKRTSGTKPARYAVTPLGWEGSIPKGIERITAPTPSVWIIGRIQTNGPSDYEQVHKFQDGFKIIPLSQWGKEPKPIKASIDPSVDMKTEPLQQVNSMDAAKYFALGSQLMKLHPPHLTDWSQLARMKRIGFEPGESFDLSKADPVIQAALKSVPADGLKAMQRKLPTLARIANGWAMNTDTMGVYGDYYMKRAIVALAGLGANQAEDAIYPLLLADADGKPVVGGKNYIIHFNKDALPPVNAFWSITMYDADGFQVANPLARFAIGDRDNLKYHSDGSLDIYIQPSTPGADKESNWLPAPTSGPLGITMRLYAPKAAALDGRWNPPSVHSSQ